MLELRILNGLHRGAAFPLDGEAIRVGSNPDNDLVLCDPAMPGHAGTFSRGVGDVWSFRSRSTGKAACPILVGAGTRLAIGPVSAVIADELAQWDANEALPAAVDRGGWPAALRTMIVELGCLAAVPAMVFGAALLWVQSTPDADAPPTDAKTGNAPAESKAIRPVDGFVYPPPATVARAPLDVLSVRHGRDGFVVTREGQVLAPGYRWRDYTVQRIEPHKIVFSGTSVAEFRW